METNVLNIATINAKWKSLRKNYHGNFLSYISKVVHIRQLCTVISTKYNRNTVIEITFDHGEACPQVMNRDDTFQICKVDANILDL
jgi:hypothetical protein